MRYHEILYEGQPPPLFHVTAPADAASIYRTGFRPSVGGEAGPGVYLIDNPAALTAEQFHGGEAIPVDVSVPILPVKDGVNRILSVLEALYGRKKAIQVYDATADRFTGSEPNWQWLHRLVRDAGYGGIRLMGHASYKNTLVFDPKHAVPRRSPGLVFDS
jgi:hypothetical protein